MTVDFSKPVQTKSGLPVRIICTDYKTSGMYTVIGLVKREDGYEETRYWTSQGRFLCSTTYSELDLENPPEQEWINIYASGSVEPCYYVGGGVYSSEEKAKKVGKTAIKTVRIK